MSRQKKARAATQADKHSQPNNTTPRPVSTYRTKKHNTVMGAAMLLALRGGQQ